MWNLDNGQPIYIQIVERIRMQIASGELAPGDKIHSVRELAIIAGVNPNTMQKALSQLEGEGLIVTQRTTGRFITTNIELIGNQKNRLADSVIRDFIDKMKNLGITKEEAITMLSTY